MTKKKGATLVDDVRVPKVCIDGLPDAYKLTCEALADKWNTPVVYLNSLVEAIKPVSFDVNKIVKHKKVEYSFDLNFSGTKAQVLAKMEAEIDTAIGGVYKDLGITASDVFEGMYDRGINIVVDTERDYDYTDTMIRLTVAIMESDEDYGLRMEAIKDYNMLTSSVVHSILEMEKNKKEKAIQEEYEKALAELNARFGK